MALVNTLDPGRTQTQLTAWLAGQLPSDAEPQVSEVKIPKQSGLSAETVMFTADWAEGGERRSRALVARVEPSGPGLYMDYAVPREAEVMRAVAAHGAVPVPAVHWAESDPEVLGAPFLVMEQVVGRVPRDDPPFTAEGWVLELSDAERALMYDNGLAAMAAVHATPIESLRPAFDLSEFGATLAEQHIGYAERMFKWASPGTANPVIEAGLGWLRLHSPVIPRELCLCWGDPRVGNLMFAEDLSVTAVLDWEAATIAVPEYDLGWWRFAMRHHSEGMGLPLPGGFPSGDAIVARFEKISGRPACDLEFWEVLNGVRFCCIVARAAGLMTAGGLLPPNAPMAINNPGTRILAEILGVTVPAGDAAYYVGNR